MTHVAVNRIFSGGGHSVKRICVDTDPQGYKQSLSRFCGRNVTSFPQIFIDDRYIGGYNDFAKMFVDTDMM